MISVIIYINGNPIIGRSATRIKGEDWETCTYKVDDGSLLLHKPNDGCIPLVKKMLDTIKE